MTDLVITSREELQSLVHRAVHDAIATYRPPEKRWMNSEEAAAYLGISPSKLHALSSNGKIPFGVVGKVRRWLSSDLDTELTRR